MAEEKPEYIFEYRGKQVPVYLDDAGQQFYIIWEGHELGLGSYNTDYEEDIKYLIDTSIDEIVVYRDDLIGGKLTWFQNGKYRDIKLTYRGRILQVYLTLRDQGSEESVPDWVKQDAQEKLEKYLARAESGN